MKTYTSPEVIEIGAADEVILGPKRVSLWDDVAQDFTMSPLSAVDADE